MREPLLAVDQFHVLRWLNADVASTRDTGAGLRPLSARIFSIFNDAFGYHTRDRLTGLAFLIGAPHARPLIFLWMG
jgi:hypothetical protein